MPITRSRLSRAGHPEVSLPVYAYKCKSCAHQFDVRQSFSDEPLKQCPECSGALRKQFNTVGVVFKGSGFYRTDSRAGSSQTGSSSASEAGASTSGSSASTSGATAASGSAGSSTSGPSASSSTSSAASR